MPKILIIGATGYLGRRLASTLVQSGQHRVYGIARSEAKARSLALEEVIPIISPDPVNEPSAYLDVIRSHNIDTVVDVAGAYGDSTKFLSDVMRIGEERLAGYQAAGLKAGPKLGFIYCSGTWVHGSSNTPVNDLDIVGTASAADPPRLVAWRIEVERAVLASSDVLDIAVIRPALIYGREHTIWTEYMLPILKASQAESTATIQFSLEPHSRPGLIHVDDVASGFKNAIERLPLINSGSVYPVFDLVTTQESMVDILGEAARVWGFKGKLELIGAGDNLFGEAMGTTFRGSSARAKQLLGWEPTRLGGLVVDMDIYAAAFESQH